MTDPPGPGWTGEPPTLTDGVVRLRPWAPTDAPFVFTTCQDPQIQRWTRVPVPYTEADGVEFVGSFARAVWADRSGLALAVIDAATGDPLGAVGIVSADHEHAIAEIGYWVAPAARRRGAARRALQLLRDWCTGPGGFRRVELQIEVENAASCAVARAAAFTLAGILPERILHRGALREIAMWSWSVDVTTDRD